MLMTPRSRVRRSGSTSRATSFHRPCTQSANGTGNPIFGRVRIVWGMRSFTASRRMRLVVKPFSFMRCGSRAANSTSTWSRNGTRLSIDIDMLIWSCFISSSTRYVFMSV